MPCHPEPTSAPRIGRRQLLAGVGALASATLVGALDTPAGADTGSPAPSDWRRALADGYLDPGAPFSTHALQEGLEVWEGARGGYMIVDSVTRTSLEASASAPSPYREAIGDRAYLGPGHYYAASAGRAVHLLTGEPAEAVEIKALAQDTAQTIHDTAIRTPSLAYLDSVRPGDIKHRVTSYGYITGCHIYPNNSGICGWVAGSIVARYWHARSSARRLLPSSYRSGTNLTANPNFATYLQGDRGNGTWARPVADRLGWNAKRQGVAASWSWVVGNIGMFSDVRNNRPVIVFGMFPVNQKGKKGGHAVVAYGETHGGHLITHYGWSNYTNIVLNAGLVGSNTKFRLN